MFSQYFGQYLLNKNIVQIDQLKEAMEQQRSTRMKLGVLAVNEGYMSAKQADEIHQIQMQKDKRFGELAVNAGYLTEEQLDKLLTFQPKQHLLLGQALIDCGYLTMEKFGGALTCYKEDHSLTDDQFSAIKDGDIDALVATLVKFGNDENKQVLTEYLSLFSKNMIRFIDDQIRIEKAVLPENYRTDWLVSQEIKGEVSLYTAIAADEKVFLQLASKYADEELVTPDEMAAGSVGEFLNLQNGIFLVNLSNRGIELEMEPQTVKHKAQISDIQSGYLITVHLSKGKFNIFLSSQPHTLNVE